MDWIVVEAQMSWVVLPWALIVLVLIVMSANAWRDTLKTDGAARPHIDDIPFRPNHYRHSDDIISVDGRDANSTTFQRGAAHAMLSKGELIDAASKMTGDIKDLTVEQIARLMTVTQFVTDLCSNEIERRDELRDHNGKAIVPYQVRPHDRDRPDASGRSYDAS